MYRCAQSKIWPQSLVMWFGTSKIQFEVLIVNTSKEHIWQSPNRCRIQKHVLESRSSRVFKKLQEDIKCNFWLSGWSNEKIKQIIIWVWTNYNSVGYLDFDMMQFEHPWSSVISNSDFQEFGNWKMGVWGWENSQVRNERRNCRTSASIFISNSDYIIFPVSNDMMIWFSWIKACLNILVFVHLFTKYTGIYIAAGGRGWSPAEKSFLKIGSSAIRQTEKLIHCRAIPLNVLEIKKLES